MEWLEVVNKMDRRIVLWVVIAILFVATLYFTFKAGAVSNLDTVRASGLVAKSAAQTGSGMVGGC